MNFKESLEYLFGLGYERSVKKFGLENSYILLEALGNPQNNFVKVQVAGTNGKGSTCAFLESVCVEAGINVGLNTSPHLVSVTERIRVAGRDISEEKFAEHATNVRAVAEDLVDKGELEAIPTFFEHITAIAQVVFADERVEVAILEAGLGGRFDATTATNAEIVAITPIDLDHTKTLGDSIEKIAAEKAAIIRAGAEAVIADQSKQAMEVILKKCRVEDVDPLLAKDVKTVSVGTDLGKSIMSFQTGKAEYEDICLSLPGKHQGENAKVAVLLAEMLAGKGFPISVNDIRGGLENAVHKGRLEYYDGILFDGAHNFSGAEALREYLEESVREPITMIFGSMRGKNLEKVANILFPLAKNLILTTPENPRAMEAKEIREFVSEKDMERVWVIDDPPKALVKARDISDSGLILVTGSLYLIGEIQAYLRNRNVERRKKKS